MEPKIPLINGKSITLEMCKKYLGKTVTLTIDQPYGTTYKGTLYKENYGYIPNTLAPDGSGIDGYYLGEKAPLSEATGNCIAIIHRLEDDDDKLVLVPEGTTLTNEQIEAAVDYREKLFKHTIVRQ